MRNELTAILVGIALGVGSASAQTDNGVIGVAWDSTGALCDRNQAPMADGTLYILAYPSGQLAGGMTGAELRVDGFPAEWPILSTRPAPPSSLSLGNPLVEGSNIAFPLCMVGTSGVVVLYTIHFFATSLVTERVLSVQSRTIPSNPNFPCPLMTPCDECFCIFCVQGRSATINYPGYCPVGVESRTWSQVRSLYR